MTRSSEAAYRSVYGTIGECLPQPGDCFVIPPLAGFLAMTNVNSCLCEPKAKQSHLSAAMLIAETSPVTGTHLRKTMSSYMVHLKVNTPYSSSSISVEHSCEFFTSLRQDRFLHSVQFTVFGLQIIHQRTMGQRLSGHHLHQLFGAVTLSSLMDVFSQPVLQAAEFSGEPCLRERLPHSASCTHQSVHLPRLPGR